MMVLILLAEMLFTWTCADLTEGIRTLEARKVGHGCEHADKRHAVECMPFGERDQRELDMLKEWSRRARCEEKA